MAQRQVKDLEKLELVFTKIPTKSLYQLQVNLIQKVQSRARTDAKILETSRVAKEVLETILIEVQIEHEEEKWHVDRPEQRLDKVFQTIMESALA
jgi:hypothetical protein